MNKPFQRIGSESNAHVGHEFEAVTNKFFASLGIELIHDLKVPVGVGAFRKEHAFDLGCEKQKARAMKLQLKMLASYLYFSKSVLLDIR